MTFEFMRGSALLWAHPAIGRWAAVKVLATAVVFVWARIRALIRKNRGK